MTVDAGYSNADYEGMDSGIRFAVKVMREAGVETFESCEAGEDHSYPEPTVRFYGTHAAGWRALTAVQDYGLPVTAIRRSWQIVDGEPSGPYWEIVFRDKIERQQ